MGTHNLHCTPTFQRYKRPSFEMKLRRNAWPAGSLPRTPLGELTALPRPPRSIKSHILLKVEERGKGGLGRERRGEEKDKVGRIRQGKWYPQFLEVTPLQTPHSGGGDCRVSRDLD